MNNRNDTNLEHASEIPGVGELPTNNDSLLVSDDTSHDEIRINKLDLISNFKKQSRSYTAQPTDEIDFQRLLIEKTADCYIKTEKNLNNVQYKTIFIHDGTIKILTRQQLYFLDILQDLIKNLLEQQVSIYVWTGAQFEKIERIDQSIQILERAKFGKIADISAAISAKRLSAEQFELYDFHRLRAVLTAWVCDDRLDKEAKSTQYALRVSDLVELSLEEQRCLQLNYLESKMPVILEVDCQLPESSDFAKYLADFEELKLFINRIPDGYLSRWIDFILQHIQHKVVALHDYRTSRASANFSLYSLITYLYQSLPNLRELAFLAEGLSEEDVDMINFSNNQKLKYLRINTNKQDGSVKKEILSKLISKIPATVEYLELPACRFRISDFHQLLSRLPNMQYLGETHDLFWDHNDCYAEGKTIDLNDEKYLAFLDDNTTAEISPDREITLYTGSGQGLYLLRNSKNIKYTHESLIMAQLGEAFVFRSGVHYAGYSRCISRHDKDRIALNVKTFPKDKYNLVEVLRLNRLLDVMKSLRMISFRDMRFDGLNDIPIVESAYHNIKYLLIDISEVQDGFLSEKEQAYFVKLFPAIEILELRLNVMHPSVELQQAVLDFFNKFPCAKRLETNSFINFVDRSSVRISLYVSEDHDYDAHDQDINSEKNEDVDEYEDIYYLDDKTDKADSVLKFTRKFYPKKNTYENQHASRLERLRVVYEGADDSVSIIPIDPYIDYHNDISDLYKRRYMQVRGVYYTEYKVQLAGSKWLQLPSLSVSDKIISLQVSEHVELGYSKKKNLYFIRSYYASNQKIKIKLILQANLGFITKNDFRGTVDQHIDLLRQSEIYDDYIEFHPNFLLLQPGEKLNAVLHYFSDFSVRPARAPSDDKNISLEQSIFKRQAGACRHRAKLAYRFLNQLDFSVRYVESQLHSFIELQEDGWVTIDLGGAPSRIEYVKSNAKDDADESFMPPPSLGLIRENQLFEGQPFSEAQYAWIDHDEPISELETTETISPGTTDPFLGFLVSNRDYLVESIDAFIDHIQSVKIQLVRKQILFLIDDWTDIDLFYRQVSDAWLNKYSADIFVAADLAEMRATVPSISNGKMSSVASPFRRYLAAPFIEKVIFVNLLNGSSDDDLSMSPDSSLVNQLFDYRRTINDISISADMLMIAVMTRKQFAMMGEDFQSRFPIIENLSYYRLISDAKKQKMFGEQAYYETEIVCTGEYTFAQLAGSYSFDQYVFSYQKGEVQRNLERGISAFTFINLPDNDSSIQSFLRKIKFSRQICCDGKLITIPSAFSYRLKNIVINTSNLFTMLELSGVDRIHLVLNNNRKKELISDLIKITDTGLEKSDPVLARYHEQSLNVLVTEKIDDHTLLKIADYAARYHININLVKMCENSDSHAGYNKPFIVASNPIQFAADHQKDFDLVICVNRFTMPSDLFGSINVIDKKTNEVVFRYTELAEALLAKQKRVLFFGDLNDDMLSYLETLYASTPYISLNGEYHYLSPGQLQVCMRKSQKSRLLFVTANDDEEVQYKKLDVTSVADGLVQDSILMVSGPLRFTDIVSSLPAGRGYYHASNIEMWLSHAGILLLSDIDLATTKELDLICQLSSRNRYVIWNNNLFSLTDEHKVLIHTEVDFDADLLDGLLKPINLFQSPRFDLKQDGAVIIKSMLHDLGMEELDDELTQTIISNIILTGQLDNESHLRFAALRFVYVFQSIQQRAVAKLSLDQMVLLAQMICQDLPPYGAGLLKAEIKQYMSQFLSNKLGSFSEQLLPAQIVPAFCLVEMLEFLEWSQRLPNVATNFPYGLLLEGAPGIGKTWLTDEILKIYGFRKVILESHAMEEDRGYVSLPPGDITTAKALLKLAVRHKWLVFFDEMNTVAEEARAYNTRDLMGEIKQVFNEMENERGYFALVATQNPTGQFNSRRYVPDCIMQHLVQVKLKEFAFDDFYELAIKHHHPEPTRIAKDFVASCASYLRSQGLFRQPTIRQYLDKMKESHSIGYQASSKIDGGLPAAKRRKIE